MVMWASMMAAMMLPGAVPAISRRAGGAAPLFAAAYLAVWTLVGLAVYALYQPLGPAAAATLTVAAAAYELTPLKRACRQRCRETAGSGLEFGFYCVGSSIGLMAILVALGLMSGVWMLVVALIALAQKLLPPAVSVDVPLALAILALGVVIGVAPSAVPGLVHAPM
jgi:predicted metal-binding membrane protein